jgi:hypothetical protein
MIAIFVLGIVLLGMMGGIVISQSNMLYKEREGAVKLALRTLEDLESLPFNVLSGVPANGDEGMYKVVRTVTFSAAQPISADSADIHVKITWSASIGTAKSVTMRREVSASAWQNIGELP